jgi:thiol-disulfide isomerase/thioredoxin
MKTILSLAMIGAIALAGASYARQPALAQQAPGRQAAPGAQRAAGAPQQQGGPGLDKLRAQNFMVTTLDGKRVTLNKLLVEGKPVVLDFWATWCGPCRQEIAHLKELSKKYSKDGVIVIGLNLEDPAQDQQAVRDFVKRNQMDYQTVFAPHQIYQFFNGAGTPTRIPQTIVFGSNGAQIKRMVGYSATVGKETLTAALDRAVGADRQRKLD